MPSGCPMAPLEQSADEASQLQSLAGSRSLPHSIVQRAQRAGLRSRENNGDIDPGTLTSINALAIDLHETGELQEAEILLGLSGARNIYGTVV